MTLVSPTAVIRDALNNRADLALSALEARTCHSWKMDLDRADVLPRSEDLSGHPSFHLYLREGSGAYAIDLDGNCYIDLSMGLGSQILGHSVASVQEAVAQQAARGWHFGLAGEPQLNLARLIQSASPANERVVFCNSGGEATAYAMRAARAFTGRDLVGVFAGSSHGAHDYGVAGEEPRRRLPALMESAALFTRSWNRRTQRHPGVPQAVADTTVNLAYGHTSAFDNIRRRRRDLAAVIVEPVRAAQPGLDHAAWLRELVNVCGEEGVLLILDERLSGFRLAYGGAQERLGAIADLVAYGEIVGGGLPLGAVAGRADVIGLLADAEERAAAERGAAGNMLAIAAGAATLTHLAARRATLYPSLEEKSRLLAESFNGFCAAHVLPVRMRCAGSIFRIHFKHPLGDTTASGMYPAAEAAFYALLLSRGILMHPSRLGFLSAAHTTGDIAQIVTACRDALLDVNSDRLFDLKA